MLLQLLTICIAVMLPMLVHGNHSVEGDLVYDLLYSYQSDVRPVRNSSKAITVEVDLALTQIVQIDENKQQLKTVVFMRWWWVDEFLTWNTSEYEGIEKIYLNPQKIWVPDITLYNSIKDDSFIWDSHYKPLVFSDGHIKWLFPAYFESLCVLDVCSFPFDRQTCNMTFGSWGYDRYGIIVKSRRNGTADKTEFNNPGEWALLDIPVVQRFANYQCCDEPYSILEFMVMVRRQPLYYIYNLLFPCILISILNVLTFLLPVESGEKISLNVTVLLTMVVFLLLVADIMPPQPDKVPVLGKYFTACISLLSLSTLASVFIIHLHFRSPNVRPMPRWVEKYVLNVLTRVLGYKKTMLRMAEEVKEVKARYARRKSLTTLGTKLGPIPLVRRASEEFKQKQVENILAGTESISNLVTDCMEDKGLEIPPERQWIALAMVIDRLFFILFLLTTICITVYVFSLTQGI